MVQDRLTSASPNAVAASPMRRLDSPGYTADAAVSFGLPPPTTCCAQGAGDDRQGARHIMARTRTIRDRAHRRAPIASNGPAKAALRRDRRFRKASPSHDARRTSERRGAAPKRGRSVSSSWRAVTTANNSHGRTSSQQRLFRAALKETSGSCPRRMTAGPPRRSVSMVSGALRPRRVRGPEMEVVSDLSPGDSRVAVTA